MNVSSKNPFAAPLLFILEREQIDLKAFIERYHKDVRLERTRLEYQLDQFLQSATLAPNKNYHAIAVLCTQILKLDREELFPTHLLNTPDAYSAHWQLLKDKLATPAPQIEKPVDPRIGIKEALAKDTVLPPPPTPSNGFNFATATKEERDAYALALLRQGMKKDLGYSSDEITSIKRAAVGRKVMAGHRKKQAARRAKKAPPNPVEKKPDPPSSAQSTYPKCTIPPLLEFMDSMVRERGQGGDRSQHITLSELGDLARQRGYALSVEDFHDILHGKMTGFIDIGTGLPKPSLKTLGQFLGLTTDEIFSAAYPRCPFPRLARLLVTKIDAGTPVDFAFIEQHIKDKSLTAVTRADLKDGVSGAITWFYTHKDNSEPRPLIFLIASLTGTDVDTVLEEARETQRAINNFRQLHSGMTRTVGSSASAKHFAAEEDDIKADAVARIRRENKIPDPFEFD